ncbi:MAG: MBL fold metallo-hydrolase [Proteobacteria bacterium]|nr:MBL fold metallo-hydrolase [Pseudomonadota bacterium]HQR02976.1 alkyl sulfatase dimerization domain-containing protein [Rhodocyclaceae bacterium]
MDTVKALVQQRPDFFACRPADLTSAVRINDYIYMSYGMSNAYMVLTDAGRVIINCGLGFEAPVHKKVFDAVCPGPTPYILLTQGHVDHVGGVALFREPQTKLIAQKNLPACQEDDRRRQSAHVAQASIWFKSSTSQMTATDAQRRPVHVQDVPTADISFDDSHVLEVGGRRFEMYSTPGGETVDSCVIWLPEDRICFSGNVFGPLFPHFPNFNTLRGDKYRWFEPYLASVRRVQALEPEILITGHFEPIVGKELIRSCLQRLHDAVDHIHRTTLKGLNEGKSIFALMREVQLPDELYVGQGYGKVSWAVRTIWESYMGWFRAEATSELYPTRPRDIFADLVKLAGTDAVVAEGRAKLGRGDMEGANLLAEAALRHDTRHRAALQLGIDAHRAILERSGATNFWETGWLKHCIEKMETTLKEIQ